MVHDVQSRIEYVQDLVAVNERYHKLCSANFRTGRNLPAIFRQQVECSKSSLGWRIDTSNAEAFLNLVEYLQENDDMQISVYDLVEKMKEYCGNKANSARCMKFKLVEH